MNPDLSACESEKVDVHHQFMKRKTSILRLSEQTGLHRQTIKRRLLDAGLLPPDLHPRAKVIEALRPASGDKDGDTIKERKTFEEWRKLKIANDAKEGALIPRAVVAECVRKLAAKFTALLDSKLENEYPAVVAGLDVPAARIYGKKLNDQIRAEVQSWSKIWEGK